MAVRVPVAVLFTLAMLASCSSGAGGDETSSGLDGSALDGRQFIATSFTNLKPVADTTISFRFDGSTVGADAGCNGMGGEYVIEDGRLLVDGLSQTEIGCDPERHAQDEFLSSFLTDRPTIALDGDVLTLSDGNVIIEATDRRVADPNRRLYNTSWRLDGIVSGDAVSSIPAGAEVTVTFDPVASAIRIEGSCNSGGASLDTGVGDPPSSGELQFGPVEMTEEGCDEPAASVEAAVFEVFSSGSADYEISAARLSVSTGANGLFFLADG